MKVFNPLNCKRPKFSTVESDLILTSSTSYADDSEYSVLIDENGNVLSKSEDI